MSMIFILLLLGVAAIFSAGALANMYGSKGDRTDFYASVVGFSFGLFALISMIGLIE
jgi:uncharacterized protein YqgC (DUF456 family)